MCSAGHHHHVFQDEDITCKDKINILGCDISGCLKKKLIMRDSYIESRTVDHLTAVDWHSQVVKLFCNLFRCAGNPVCNINSVSTRLIFDKNYLLTQTVGIPIGASKAPSIWLLHNFSFSSYFLLISYETYFAVFYLLLYLSINSITF